MRQAILYQLIKNLENGDAYIPVFGFMGDVYCKELKLGGFVSHEVSPRISELNSGNPGMMEFEKRKAKYSSATYYAWRLKPPFTPSIIKDYDLEKFARKVWNGERQPQRTVKYDPERNCMVETFE